MFGFFSLSLTREFWYDSPDFDKTYHQDLHDYSVNLRNICTILQRIEDYTFCRTTKVCLSRLRVLKLLNRCFSTPVVILFCRFKTLLYSVLSGIFSVIFICMLVLYYWWGMPLYVCYCCVMLSNRLFRS